ncbi:alpha/beta fold hydrolase [Adlercreutzia faecimuris]|uniref:Alpha/beta hydrolase n=1 Tax=Adlercreutzia faecimuris TaxID=2897341 RepID=A0ABS9WGG9_9ACTN|nr:alpha/beta hydrolase [Adlercreutzia sp. JBNU-10]MCI2241680.1 alpha/beta hydrolase [Adlercreutzia sp. JBNU-10]
MTGAGRPEAAPTPLGFRSSDGATAARGLLWQPADAASAARPRGIVQVVHGMSEHIGRYDELARFLASHGFVVCGHDHLGHGKTAPDPALRGVMPARGGADAIVADVGALRSIVSARYARDVPYFLLGHSMGSLVTRVYLAGHGEGLAGAVICGTAGQPLAVCKAGNLLARTLAAVRGDDARIPLLHALADGAFSRSVRGARTPFDWLSRDEEAVDAFIADEACGFMFSAGGYATLTELAFRAGRPAAFAAVPKGLPVLFIAGDADPVGDRGRGVENAATRMRAAGVADVTLRLYEGMRHEIFNEIGREQVLADLLAWLDAHA